MISPYSQSTDLISISYINHEGEKSESVGTAQK